MCGRYVIQPDEFYEELFALVDEIEKQQKTRTGEIYPTNVVPVITDQGSGREVHLYKWGFPSFRSSGVIINARAETIEEKPMFRKSFHEKRCIIPSNGFYEWKQGSDTKEKFHIGLSDYPTMYMAGIYNTFQDKDGQAYQAFAIVTIAANQTMSEIHQRMPVILEPDTLDLWLKKDPDTMDAVRALLRQYDRDMFLKPVVA